MRHFLLCLLWLVAGAAYGAAIGAALGWQRRTAVVAHTRWVLQVRLGGRGVRGLWGAGVAHVPQLCVRQLCVRQLLCAPGAKRWKVWLPCTGSYTAVPVHGHDQLCRSSPQQYVSMPTRTAPSLPAPSAPGRAASPAARAGLLPLLAALCAALAGMLDFLHNGYVAAVAYSLRIVCIACCDGYTRCIGHCIGLCLVHRVGWERAPGSSRNWGRRLLCNLCWCGCLLSSRPRRSSPVAAALVCPGRLAPQRAVSPPAEAG